MLPPQRGAYREISAASCPPQVRGAASPSSSSSYGIAPFPARPRVGRREPFLQCKSLVPSTQTQLFFEIGFGLGRSGRGDGPFLGTLQHDDAHFAYAAIFACDHNLNGRTEGHRAALLGERRRSRDRRQCGAGRAWICVTKIRGQSSALTDLRPQPMPIIEERRERELVPARRRQRGQARCEAQKARTVCAETQSPRRLGETSSNPNFRSIRGLLTTLGHRLRRPCIASSNEHTRPNGARVHSLALRMQIAAKSRRR